MPVLVSFLRGINVGGHHKISMEALGAVYDRLKLRDARTYLQTGNVVFRALEKNHSKLAARIEDALEETFGFRPDVVLRTTSEMRDVVARNPFANRQGLEPAKLAVTFLPIDPGAVARKKLEQINTDPEELRIDGREVYIYFPNGMGRSTLPWASIGKILQTTGTSRNWNTVTKLAAAAEELEKSK
jgi:uncharacterized protein (DUF1697 family)